MKHLSPNLRNYMNRKLETIAYLKSNLDTRHGIDRERFSSAEEGLTRAIYMAQDRGERVQEYLKCYKAIMDEVYEEEGEYD